MAPTTDAVDFSAPLRPASEPPRPFRIRVQRLPAVDVRLTAPLMSVLFRIRERPPVADVKSPLTVPVTISVVRVTAAPAPPVHTTLPWMVVPTSASERTSHTPVVGNVTFSIVVEKGARKINAPVEGAAAMAVVMLG